MDPTLLIAKENWPLLEQAYQRSSQQARPGLEQSFLVHSIEDEDLWQIITVQIITIWSGMPSLKQVQRAIEAGVTPRGTLIFREAHAEPTHTAYEVVQHRVSAPKEA